MRIKTDHLLENMGEVALIIDMTSITEETKGTVTEQDTEVEVEVPQDHQRHPQEIEAEARILGTKSIDQTATMSPKIKSSISVQLTSRPRVVLRRKLFKMISIYKSKILFVSVL